MLWMCCQVFLSLSMIKNEDDFMGIVVTYCNLIITMEILPGRGPSAALPSPRVEAPRRNPPDMGNETFPRFNALCSRCVRHCEGFSPACFKPYRPIRGSCRRRGTLPWFPAIAAASPSSRRTLSVSGRCTTRPSDSWTSTS